VSISAKCCRIFVPLLVSPNKIMWGEYTAGKCFDWIRIFDIKHKQKVPLYVFNRKKTSWFFKDTVMKMQGNCHCKNTWKRQHNFFKLNK
jgi:hypothetical protein